jgi:hypothetical protein
MTRLLCLLMAAGLVKFFNTPRLEKTIVYIVFRPIPKEAGRPLLMDRLLLRRGRSCKVVSMAWSGRVGQDHLVSTLNDGTDSGNLIR